MEEITLEKIDMLRQRTGLGYAAAKEILEKNNGNLVDALIYIEQNQKTFGQNLTETTNELIDTIKEIIKKGNVNRIKVKKENRILVNIPVTAGIAAGTLGLFYPSLLVIGAATAILSKVVIEVEKSDGNVEVINDIIKNKYENVKDKAEDIADKAEAKINNIKEDILNDGKNESNNE